MAKQRYIDNKPVREAPEGMLVSVQSPDIDTGVPGDRLHCAMVKALERKKGVLSAKVDRTVAVVEFEDRWDRFILSKQARLAVAAFDMAKGKGLSRLLTGTFAFLAPSPSQTTARILARAKASQTRTGGKVTRPRPGTGPRHDPLALVGVRNASGHSHTSAARLSHATLASDAAVVSEIVRKTGKTLPEAMGAG